MRTRWKIRAALPLLALSAGACGDSTGPSGNLTDFLLDFCAARTPVFLAVQNDGATWSRVQPDAQGTFAFQVADEVGIAFVHQEGASYRSEFLFVTSAELQPLNGVACNELNGSKDLHGNVSGVDVGQHAWVSMAGDTTDIAANQSTFSLFLLPSGPLDLVAHRDVVTLNGPAPDRVIVRRAQNFTSGATMSPTFDFNGGDSENAVSNTLTVSGLVSGEENEVFVDFRTATGTTHPLQLFVGFSGSVQTIAGIPAGLTQSGDLHNVDMFAFASSNDRYRAVRQFNRNAGNRTAALGPSLATPTISIHAASPFVQLRAQLPAQADYAAFVSTDYIQGDQTSTREVIVTATAAYIGGTPSVWDITIPNLSGVSGFPTQAMLQQGFATTWYVDAFGGGVPATFFGYPTDGALLRQATRSNAVALSQLSRTDGERASTQRSVRRIRGGL